MSYSIHEVRYVRQLLVIFKKATMCLIQLVKYIKLVTGKSQEKLKTNISHK